MSASSGSLTLNLEGRQVQAVLGKPEGTAQGLAVVAHPHPLFGGTMDNKVVQTLARACVTAGWECLRFNFRGVGSSQGVYDEGRGETQDLVKLVEQLAPHAPLVLAGFSFGAFVTCQAVQALWPTGRLKKSYWWVPQSAISPPLLCRLKPMNTHWSFTEKVTTRSLYQPSWTGPDRSNCPSPSFPARGISFMDNCPC